MRRRAGGEDVEGGGGASDDDAKARRRGVPPLVRRAVPVAALLVVAALAFARLSGGDAPPARAARRAGTADGNARASGGARDAAGAAHGAPKAGAKRPPARDAAAARDAAKAKPRAPPKAATKPARTHAKSPPPEEEELEEDEAPKAERGAEAAAGRSDVGDDADGAVDDAEEDADETLDAGSGQGRGDEEPSEALDELESVEPVERLAAQEREAGKAGSMLTVVKKQKVASSEPEEAVDTEEPPRRMGYAKEVCSTWRADSTAQATVRKSYWVETHSEGNRYMHMLALERLHNGTVLGVWQASEEGEGTDDQHIQLAVSRDGGRWSKSWKLPVNQGLGAQWAPVPYVADDGVVHLFYAESEGECVRDTKPRPKWPPGGTLLHTKSTDLVHWSKPRSVLSIDAEGFIPKVAANKVVKLSTGALVLPFWRENLMLSKTKWPDAKAKCRTQGNKYGQPATNEAQPSAGVLVSMDEGKSWGARGTLVAPGADGQPGTWLIENSVVEVGRGGMLMLFRTHAGYIYQALSSDGGHTWTKPRATSMPNPDAKVQMMRLQPDGPLVLAYNDHKRLTMVGNDGNEVDVPDKCRSQLSLALSNDNGRTWRRIGVLRGGLAPGLRFHYPWMLQAGCKLLVGYSKFYVSGFRHSEPDRELGLRVASVTM